MEDSLKHIIYGTAVIADQANGTPDILAISDGVVPELAAHLRTMIPLDPLPLDAIHGSQAIAMVAATFKDSDYYVVARAHYQQAGRQTPVYQYVLIPDSDKQTYQNFEALTQLFREPIPLYNVINAPADALTVSQVAPPSKDKQVMIIKSVLEDLMDNHFEPLITVLSAAIQNPVHIHGFPVDNNARLLLMRGLRLLLPRRTRPLLTFTTQTTDRHESMPCISFGDTIPDESRPVRVLDWQALPTDEASELHPYVRQLHDEWHDNVIELVDTIARFDEIADGLTLNNDSLNALLMAVTARHELDLLALQGTAINPEQIMSAFESTIPMTDALQTAYAILLLENNFQSRDTTGAIAVASVIENNGNLNERLEPFINSSIEEQPDAVYAFVRTHLHSTDDENVTQRWLTRLHDAAQHAVDIALASADAETIRSWLTLISREPMRYQLTDILRYAILEAKTYARDNTDLAQEILKVALRRQPEMLDGLLTDPNILESISDTVRKAIVDHDGAAIEALSAESRDLFLLSLQQAIQNDAQAINAACVRALWQVYTHQQTRILPVQFRPRSLIDALVKHPACFVNGAYMTLLTLALGDGKQDDLFYEIVTILSEQEQIAEGLAQALAQSNRESDAILDVVSSLLAKEAVAPQTAVDTLARFLINRGWDEDSTPYIEQLARLMSQYPDTTAQMPVLWKLLERSAIHKSEQMLKVAQRRLLEGTAHLVAEAQIVENVKTIRQNSSWSTTGKAVLIKWWRQFAREQGTGQLQKIDKLLDGNRSLEDLRAIVQTMIAMRRIIGDRSLEEFSELVASTYTLLQALSEGFDPNDKLVDSNTIRQEMDARTEELPVALRPVLSTNLRELAQLVTTLSENRSKPSLIRSDDAVERQLATGEQEPDSAIDVMRWLSGYLDGLQKEDDA